MEHKNQKKDQKNAESSKNNSIDDLFHMKDNDFSLCMTNIHTCGKIKITVCKRKTYENKSLLLTVGR